MTLARLLRAAAILIALAGLVDPAMTSSRPIRRTVSVITPQGPDDVTAQFADRVARDLAANYDVARTTVPGAAAVVSIGDRVPVDADTIAVPVIAVIPPVSGPALHITSLQAPRQASLETRASLLASVHAIGARGLSVETSLSAGDVVVQRVTHEIKSDDETIDVPLALVPSAEGLILARVTARLTGSGAPQTGASAATAIRIQSDSWPVLFYDVRPSWMSTFVRRAIEDDTRFVVSSRTITSKAVATATTGSPARLGDAGSLARFKAIVVGAPDALSSDDVGGLDRYVRERAGAVVLLMDSADDLSARSGSRPIDRLDGVSTWTVRTSAKAAPIKSGTPDDPAIEAAEIATPDRLPVGAEVVATVAADSAASPAIWRVPAGAGRIVVSGALDSWRFRTSKSSAFDRFWRQTMAAAASESPAAIEIAIDRPLVATGETTTARVVVTDAAFAADRTRVDASVSATMNGPSGSAPLRVWPEGPAGRFTIALPARAAPGTYRLTVVGGADRANAEWIVAPAVTTAAPDERRLVEIWAQTRGGRVISTNSSNEIRQTLVGSIKSERRDETWHPMREPWWIVPFALLLGGEWFLRRGQRSIAKHL